MSTRLKKDKLTRGQLKEAFKQQQKLINCFEEIIKFIFENDVPDKVSKGVNEISVKHLGASFLVEKAQGLIIKPGGKQW